MTAQLSLDEVQANMPRMAERFSTIDKDKNGLLSQEELQRGGGHRSRRTEDLIFRLREMKERRDPRGSRRFLLASALLA